MQHFPKNAFMKLVTKEMKSKTSARFKPTTHRLLAYPQLTQLCGKLSNFIQFKIISKTSFSLFISRGSL